MNESARDELPFAAPCRNLAAGAPWRWLRAGWRDFLAAPRQSLVFGALAVVTSYAISIAAWQFGNLGLYLGLLSGFVFLGPLFALTLYSLSDQLQRSVEPSLASCVRAAMRAVGNAMLFAVVLLVIFLVWARAASMVHVFFPSGGETAMQGLGVFLAVGTAVGAVFAAIVFMASAFSLPMLIDRRTDAITAVITSVNAVLRNKPAMALWAALIVVLMLVGFATAYLGLAVLLPVAGYASWHAYRETIDASRWPLQERE